MLGFTGLILRAYAAGNFDHLVDTYRELDEHRAILVAAYVLQGLASLALIPVLRYLYRAAAYRDPDTAPRWAGQFAVLGPVVLAVTSVLLAVLQLEIIDEVLAASRSEEGAENVVEDKQAETFAIVVLSVAVGASLALAAAFIMISRFARRVGLLSQFIGILGVIVGVIIVLGPLLGGGGVGALPIVQWFWLGSLTALFLGRWPGGRGPAWESGEAEPWPSAAELRAEAAAEGGEAPRPRGLFAPRAPDPDPEPDPEPEPARPAHPRSKKRKRKKGRR